MKIKIKKQLVPRNEVGHDSSAAPAPVPAQSGPSLSVAPPSARAQPTSNGAKKPIKIKLKRKRDDPVGSSPAPAHHVATASRQFPLTHAPSELSSLSHSEFNGKLMAPPMAVKPSLPAQPLSMARPAKRIKLKVNSSKPTPAPAVSRIAIKKPHVAAARIAVDRPPAPVAHMPPPSLPSRKAVPAMHGSPATAPRIVPALKPKIKIKKTLPSVSVPAAPVREPVAVKARPPPRQRQSLPEVLPKRRKPPDLPGPGPSKKIKVKNGIKPVQSGKQLPVTMPQASAKAAPEPKVPVQPAEAMQLAEGTAFLESLTAAISEELLVQEKALLTMVNKLLRKDRENLFRTEPQKTNLHSRVKNAYKAAIKQPIALATIRDYIRGLDGKIKLRTWKQMENALDLMVANCVHFNGDDSHLSKTARGIRAEFTRLRDKDAAAEAMAAAEPAEQAADYMPRLRSAMTETLPPRRAAVAASLAREHTTKRGGGRGGGARAARVTHMTMRMLDTGIRRVIEPNARFSYHKKEADFTTFGCTLGAWNLETGRSIWLTRPRLAHAYPKRYVPFGSAALKQAFHLGSMCGRLADLIKSNAAKTVFLPRKAVPQAAPPAAAPAQAGQQHAVHAAQPQQQQTAQVQPQHAAQAQQQQATQAQPQLVARGQQQPSAQVQARHMAQAQQQSTTAQAAQQRTVQAQQQQAVRAQQQQQQLGHASQVQQQVAAPAQQQYQHPMHQTGQAHGQVQQHPAAHQLQQPAPQLQQQGQLQRPAAAPVQYQMPQQQHGSQYHAQQPQQQAQMQQRPHVQHHLQQQPQTHHPQQQQQHLHHPQQQPQHHHPQQQPQQQHPQQQPQQQQPQQQPQQQHHPQQQPQQQQFQQQFQQQSQQQTHQQAQQHPQQHPQQQPQQHHQPQQQPQQYQQQQPSQQPAPQQQPAQQQPQVLSQQAIQPPQHVQ